MERLFSSWADIIARRTCWVFCISLFFFILLASGMTQAKTYEDEEVIWTPAGNPTLKNKEKAEALFDKKEKYRIVNLIIEAKDGGNVLTVGALREMAAFEVMMRAVTECRDATTSSTGKIERPCSPEAGTFDWSQICYLVQEDYTTPQLTSSGAVVTDTFGNTIYEQKTRDKCHGGSYDKPLDLFYSLETGQYEIPDDLTDEQLLAKINEGKGDRGVFKGDTIVYLPTMLGEPTPSDFTQNTVEGSPLAGVNNVKSAKAVQYTYLARNNRNDDLGDRTIDEKGYMGWESKLHDDFEVWKADLKFISPNMSTIFGFVEAIQEDINHDLNLILMAILLVGFYTFLFLGSFSPMHCRCFVAIAGLVCVLFSYLAGFGFMYYCGGESTGVHQLMPFLLIGIGVDDMFVLCNSVDQTDLKKTAFERVHEALGHSGPAVTITSLTNCLAFAFGAANSLPALKSFCLFASMSIFFLYLAAMTLFMCVVYWDTKRVEIKMNECCKACFCSETSIICCFGALQSPKQQAYCGVELSPEKIQKMKDEEEKASPEVKTVLQASGTERCLGKYFAPVVLSNVGRLVFLAIYAIMLIGAIYGASQVEIHFEVDFFISESSTIFSFYTLQKKYYDKGGGQTSTIYIDSTVIDWSTEENQRQLMLLDQKLIDLKPCGETGTCTGWHVPESLSSWYRDFKQAVKLGELACQTANPALEIIPPSKYAACFGEWIETAAGKSVKSQISLSDKGQIRGWQQFITPIKITAISTDGPDYLHDLRDCLEKYGFDDTYAYSQALLDYEQYVVFVNELSLSVGLSLTAVFLVVIFVTGSLPVTLLVLLAVCLVDLFLLALIHYWDLTMNNIIVVNLVIGLGLAVDYAAHIAHTYLIVEAPKTMTIKEKRMYKARVAVSSMGSSVVHGGTSTFLAVIVLSAAKSYIFEVFFKMWFGIIVFGMANGFILLPIILSFIGPTPDPEAKSKEKVEMVRRMSSIKRMNTAQLAALKASAGIVDSDTAEAEKDKTPNKQEDLERSGIKNTDNDINVTESAMNPVAMGASVLVGSEKKLNNE